jgi:hypothetical protein
MSRLDEDRLTYAQRKALPDSAFGWPEKRAFPLIDKKRVRNAPARLSMSYRMGHVSYARAMMIHHRIVAAGKHFGVHIKSPPTWAHRAERYEHRRAAAENPLSTPEIALIAGGVVIVGGLGYLFYKASQPATAAASPLNQPITYGQISGATPAPSLLAPGFQGQASGPAPAASTNAPTIDMGTVAS